MHTPTLVRDAVESLLKRFEAGDYNPTPLIDLGALVANADGKVEAEELEALRGILEPMLGADIDDELVSFLIQASAKTIAAYGLAPRLRVVAQILEDCDAVEQGIMVALAIAFASKRFGAAERSVVEQLATEVDLPKTRLDALVEQVKNAYAAPSA